MANIYADGTGKRHRDRKNPTAAEAWRKQKHERNAARGKQFWVLDITDVNGDFDETVPEGGRWARISVA
jgi:hypothetical protein